MHFTQFSRMALLASAWAIACSASLHAQQDAGQQKKTFQAGDVFLSGSRVYIHVYKTGFGHEHAVTGMLKSGNIDMTGKQPGQLVFDMTSFVADTQAARKYIGLEGATDTSTQQQVTATMRSAEVLDVGRHPTATFAIESVRELSPSAKGVPRWQLDGTFTLHGASRPISVPVEVTQERAGWNHVRGSFSILQTEYGITPYRKALGAVGVGDRLDITGDIWVARPASSSQPAAGDR